jgi:hypothetical protein
MYVLVDIGLLEQKVVLLNSTSMGQSTTVFSVYNRVFIKWRLDEGYQSSGIHDNQQTINFDAVAAAITCCTPA